MPATCAPLPSRLPRLFVVTGLGSLALAWAAAGSAAANPFGVTRQGGDAIAALKSLTPEQARALVAKRSDATARIGTGKAALAFARGGVSFRGALMLTSLESLDAETAAALAGFPGSVSLDGLTEVSPELVRALGDLNKRSIKGVTSLSPEAAAAVVEGFRGASLTLKRVSPRTLTALIENGNIELPPSESLELIAEPDGSFTDDFVIPENYPARGRRR